MDKNSAYPRAFQVFPRDFEFWLPRAVLLCTPIPARAIQCIKHFSIVCDAWVNRSVAHCVVGTCICRIKCLQSHMELCEVDGCPLKCLDFPKCICLHIILYPKNSLLLDCFNHLELTFNCNVHHSWFFQYDINGLWWTRIWMYVNTHILICISPHVASKAMGWILVGPCRTTV